MARMSIDDMFLRDPRVLKLARATGEIKQTTRGRLLDVFAPCYDRVSDVMTVAEVDLVSELSGFARGMLEVGLADLHEASDEPDGSRGAHNAHNMAPIAVPTKLQDEQPLRIRGVRERILYLHRLRATASEGGRKSGESRRNRREAKTNHVVRADAEKAEATANAPAPAPVPDPAPAPAPKGARGTRTRRAASGESAAAKTVEFQHSLDVFDTRYREAYGRKPSWNGRTCASLKKLVAAHGNDEVVRRIGILFSSPPAFLTGPHDVGTLVQHFDKLAQPARARRTVAQEQMDRQIDRVEMLKRQAANPHAYDGPRPTCDLCGEPPSDWRHQPQDVPMDDDESPPWERA